MPIQNYNIYTAKGYAGDLVDSGPRVVQTGVLTSATADFGLAMKRDSATVPNGVALGSAAGAVYAIAQREYNHEAATRPSDGTTQYNITESVSLIRQGYLYVELTGATDIVDGEVLHVDSVTGEFTKATVAGNIVATTNVFADENLTVTGGLDILKIRIDIVS